MGERNDGGIYGVLPHVQEGSGIPACGCCGVVGAAANLSLHRPSRLRETSQTLMPSYKGKENNKIGCAKSGTKRGSCESGHCGRYQQKDLATSPKNSFSRNRLCSLTIMLHTMGLRSMDSIMIASITVRACTFMGMCTPIPSKDSGV